jgi:hypothetical protein
MMSSCLLRMIRSSSSWMISRGISSAGISVLGGGGSTATTTSPRRRRVDGLGTRPLTVTTCSRIRRWSDVRLRNGMRSTR